jgi:monothiol glutaredoxin
MMSDLSPEATAALRARIDAHRVVLFMKGTRSAPRCGFSARVVGSLDELLSDYVTWDVLADDELREDLKRYADWPTYPQLWVAGELVGGADIVAELAERGELASTLGVTVEATAAPTVHITDTARDRLMAALDGEDVPVRLVISPQFEYRFEVAEARLPRDVDVTSNGITLRFDPASARRADGLQIDVPAGTTSLVITNPNEPPAVRPLSVDRYDAWRREGRPHLLLDVRTLGEWETARIDGAELVGDVLHADLSGLDRQAEIVVMCHHGVRSRYAAEHLIAEGFTKVWNLSGGIDAWSAQIDGAVPRY